MEILLFQWSQVSKHPELKPQVDTWFSRFKVSINLNIFFYYVNLVSLLKLLKFSSYKFFTSMKYLNGRELIIILRGGFRRIML
jgi:hypothetical protein